MRILLVEDDDDRREALKGNLTSNKSSVITANNGYEGLIILEEDQNFELILCDVNMPFMDGYDFAERVKKDARFQNIRFYAYSSKELHRDNINLLIGYKIDRFLLSTIPLDICTDVKLYFS